MSDLRIHLSLDVLQEIAGQYLGEPQMSHDEVPLIEKPPGKGGKRASKRQVRRKR
jgi:hypothetical protein